MKPSNQDQYRAVSINELKKLTRDIDFDVFVRLSEGNFTHVFSRSTGLDYARIAHYVHKGVKELYIPQADYDAYVKFKEKNDRLRLAEEKPNSELGVAALLNMTDQALSDIFLNFSITDESVGLVKNVTKKYIRSLGEDPSSLSLLIKMSQHGDYFYSHSLTVSIFSLILANTYGQFDDETMVNIGLGAFLHDIGYTQIQNSFLYSDQTHTKEELDLIQSHPRLGLRMLADTNIPEEAKQIVYQHHENCTGTGYPNRLPSGSISFGAKVVGLADFFASLVAPKPPKEPYLVENAVQVVMSNASKFDPTLLRILKSTLVKALGGRAAA